MYKFYVLLNSITREVTPLNADKLSLVTDKESGKIFFRTKLNGSPLFAGSDFEFFNQVEHSHSRCSTVEFHVHKKCNGSYSLYWIGKFGMNSGKWNPDKCTVEFEIEVNDEYTDILKNAKKKVNILDLPGGNAVSATISGYRFERANCGGITTEGQANTYSGCKIRQGLQEGGSGIEFGSGQQGPSFEHIVGTCNDYSIDDGWVPYYAIYPKATQTNVIPARYVHEIQMQFIREYAETPDVDGEPVEPIGGGWIPLEGKVEINGFIYSRWARTPFGELSFNYTWSLQPGCVLRADLEIDFGTVDTFNRNRIFNDAMEYVTQQAFGMGVVSDFFSHNGDDTYPENEAYTKAKENLSNLLIAQKSDIIDPYSSEPARKGELTFEELAEIWKIFNCDWRLIDGSIRVEHVSYWQNVGQFDLTTSQYEKYSKYNNSYEYERELAPKTELFEFMETSVNEDFVGLPIEYDSICVNQDPESNSKTFKVNATTDISFIRTKRDVIANEGFVLIVHDGEGNVKEEAGRITNLSLPNNHLSWANLHWNYHRWGRVLDSGTMNGINTMFFSIFKQKKQVPITIPYCCTEINPYGTIKTFLGTGDLLTMEENLYTGMVKIEVIHGTGELTGSLEDRQFDDSFDLSFN
jgi:hypothetical protein